MLVFYNGLPVQVGARTGGLYFLKAVYTTPGPVLYPESCLLLKGEKVSISQS